LVQHQLPEKQVRRRQRVRGFSARRANVTTSRKRWRIVEGDEQNPAKRPLGGPDVIFAEHRGVLT
jgi:hypothetical protein